MQRRTEIESPIGPLTLTIDESGNLVGLSMAGWHGHRDAEPHERNDPAFAAIASQLDAYFAGTLETFAVPVAPAGNAFQRSVWNLLAQIPYGETRSYGDLADALGDKTLARAVGTACGSNPIALVIPCHRVIRADGSLTGFGGGLDRKEFLLHLENSAAFPLRPRLFV